MIMCAAGITGGFAGGERGVQQFVEKGELELVKPGKGESPAVKLLQPCKLLSLDNLAQGSTLSVSSFDSVISYKTSMNIGTSLRMILQVRYEDANTPSA